MSDSKSKVRWEDRTAWAPLYYITNSGNTIPVALPIRGKYDAAAAIASKVIYDNLKKSREV